MVHFFIWLDLHKGKELGASTITKIKVREVLFPILKSYTGGGHRVFQGFS